MPIPMTMEMNITEKMVRWPTVRAMIPMDHARVTASTTSMRSGLPTRQNASIMTRRVRANAIPVAMLLSSKAAVISSLERVGPPVTPACTLGKSGLSLAITPRMTSMARRSPMKLPLSDWGVSTRAKSRLLSSEGVPPVGPPLTQREQSTPWRAVGCGPIEPVGYLLEHELEESGVLASALLEAQIEEIRHESRGHRRVGALDEAGEAWIAGKALHEFLVVEDPVTHFLELRGGQVEELPALEALRIHAVGHAGEFDGGNAQLVDKAGRVGLGGLERPRFDDDDDVLELTEFAGVLVVADDVSGVPGQEVTPGRAEAQGVKGIDDAGHREEQRDGRGHEGPTAGKPHEAPEDPAGPRYGDHVMTTIRSPKCITESQRGLKARTGIRLDAAVDEALEPHPRGLVRPLLGRRLHQVRRGSEERALEASIHGDLARADGIDDHPGRVGRVPHLELELDVDGLVTEGAALQANMRPLAVVEPRHVVAGSDVYVVGGYVVGELRADGVGLGDLLGGEARALEHVQEVGVAPDIELARVLHVDAAVHEELGQYPVDDGGAHLRLDVVAHHGQP